MKTIKENINSKEFKIRFNENVNGGVYREKFEYITRLKKGKRWV